MKKVKQRPLNCTNTINVTIVAEMEVQCIDDIEVNKDSIRHAVDELQQYGIANATITGKLSFDIEESL